MGKIQILACAAILASLVLTYLILRMAHRRSSRPAATLLLLLFVNAIAICASFVAGANLEVHHKWWSSLRAELPQPKEPFEPFEVSGDPSLALWLQNQKPQLPRPEFKPQSNFQSWQEALRKHLREQVFQLPDVADSMPPETTTVSETRVDDEVTRKLIAYKGFDGTTIPAYLFEPSQEGRRPAVVVVPGHGQGIVETAGLVKSYQHAAAMKLALAGYVVLTPELRGFGYLGARIDNEHRITAYNAIVGGSSLKAVLVKDLQRAVDLLQSLDNVDPQRFAMTGVSYGGELSAAYAAIDLRIRVVVVQGHIPTVGPRKGRSGDPVTIHDTPHYCHLIPGQNTHFAREDFLLLIPPRPLLIVRGKEEASPSDTLIEHLREAFTAVGQADDFAIAKEPGRHEYFVKPAVKFLSEKL